MSGADDLDIAFDPATACALPESFFARSPVLVAPDLLGCVLVSTAGGFETGGVIVETEAYLGADDPGSHAATRGMTPRNSVMFGPPGRAYVYFTYGNHHMLNFVCEPEGHAGGVLIRALRPTIGLDTMTSRRHGRPLGELCRGPGKLCAALGVDLADNAIPLRTGRLTVYHGDGLGRGEIAVSGRVGLSQGHELPLRYFYENSPFVSRGRTGPPAQKRRTTGPRGGSK